MVRRLLARKLKKVLPHMTLTEADTSACALKAIQSSAFDMIVLDQHIEDCTGSVSLKGTELARLARSCGSKAIIAGYSANPMRAEHLAAGCDLSWGKSISVQEIRKSLMRCMRGGDMTTSVQNEANEGARSKSGSSSKRRRTVRPQSIMNELNVVVIPINFLCIYVTPNACNVGRKNIDRIATLCKKGQRPR